MKSEAGLNTLIRTQIGDFAFSLNHHWLGFASTEVSLIASNDSLSAAKYNFFKMPPQEGMIESNSNDKNHALEIKQGFANPVFVPDGCQTSGNIDDKEKKTEKEAFEFDDLLPYVGEFGIYQKILFLLMIPFAFFVAWVYFSQIFIAIVPEHHWCWVPELANLTVEER